MNDIARIAEIIDLRQVITLIEAAKLIRGRGGKPPHVATLRRWANHEKGYQLPGGGKAVLKTVRVGQEIVTLREWVEAFEARRATGGVREEQPRQKSRPVKRRAGGHRRAGKALDQAGVK